MEEMKDIDITVFMIIGITVFHTTKAQHIY